MTVFAVLAVAFFVLWLLADAAIGAFVDDDLPDDPETDPDD